MSELLHAPLIPTLEWRMLAAACRGMFLAEQILRQGLELHWLVQAVCAGYGPLGIYRTLGALIEAGHLENGRVPRLMAIQQSGLCPIVNAWHEGKAMLPPVAELHGDEPLLEPALYNTYPDQTYPDLFHILTRWKGCALAVTQPEFDEYGREFRGRIEDAGIRLTETTAQGPRVVERAGLLAGAGALKGISEGRVARGETVLCALTGGAGPTLAKPALPEARIGLAEDLEQAVCRLANRFAKGN
jgi:threonine synthase